MSNQYEDKELKHSNSGELKEAILSRLQHAYYNRATDVVAYENGVIPGYKHVPVVLENYADEILQLIEAREQAAYNRGREVERAATKIFTDAKVRAAEERLLDEVEEKMSYASVHSVNINDYEGYMGEFISLTRQALKEKET